MANHKSAEKRVRQITKRRLHNRYYKKTTRNTIQQLTDADKKEAQELLPKAIGMIDKLAKKNLIHQNKAAHLKSQLTKLVASKE